MACSKSFLCHPQRASSFAIVLTCFSQNMYLVVCIAQQRPRDWLATAEDTRVRSPWRTGSATNFQLKILRSVPAIAGAYTPKPQNDNVFFYENFHFAGITKMIKIPSFFLAPKQLWRGWRKSLQNAEARKSLSKSSRCLYPSSPSNTNIGFLKRFRLIPRKPTPFISALLAFCSIISACYSAWRAFNDRLLLCSYAMIQTNKETRSTRTTVRLLAQVTKTFWVFFNCWLVFPCGSPSTRKALLNFPKVDSDQSVRICIGCKLPSAKSEKQVRSPGNRVFKLVAKIGVAHSDWHCTV